jgi:hypothetical protein
LQFQDIGFGSSLKSVTMHVGLGMYSSTYSRSYFVNTFSLIVCKYLGYIQIKKLLDCEAYFTIPVFVNCMGLILRNGFLSDLTNTFAMSMTKAHATLKKVTRQKQHLIAKH